LKPRMHQGASSENLTALLLEPTILVVIMAVFNDGAMIALSKDRVIASKLPNSWNLPNIFIMGIVYGLYLTLSSIILYIVSTKTMFWTDHCSLFSLNDQDWYLTTWCARYIDQTVLPGTFPQSIPGFNTNGMSLGQILDSPQGIAGGYQPAPTMYGGVSIPYSNAYNFSLCVLNGPGDYNYQLTNVNAYMPGACNGFSYTNMSFQPTGVPTLLEQCKTEQKYTRGAMMRSLLYNQVSISGQALVFVVRTQEWSVMARAGTLTYMAFILAQIGSTCIALFGFAGYSNPRYQFTGCSFCQLSSGGDIPFFSGQVPIALTESAFSASVVGCTGYVIVAWIWAAIWYFPLDLIKWALCWILNEDGFRDGVQHRSRSAPAEDKGAPTVSGATTGSHGNPLGRQSLSKVPAQVLDKASASVVALGKDKGGNVGVSSDSSKNLTIARKSLVKTNP